MPRAVQSAKDRRLASVITQRYWTSAEHRVPRVDAWDKSYEAHDPQYIDDTKVTKPPKVKFPYLHRVTEQQATQLMEATDAGPQWLEARPTTKGYQENAEAVTRWLDWTYQYKSAAYCDNNRVQHKAWARMGLKYGNSYMYAEWNVPEQRIQFRCIDPYDVYLDARYGRYIIVRRVVTLAQVRDLAESVSSPGDDDQPRDGGRALKAFRKIERDIRAGKLASWAHTKDYYGHGTQRRFANNRVAGDPEGVGDESRVSAQDDPFNATVVLLEYYETHRDGVIARVVPNFADGGDSLIIEAEQNPYGCAPIAPFLPHPVDNEFYGLGNGEIIGKLADVMDYGLRGGLSMIGAMAWPPLQVTRRSQLRKKRLNSLYGAIIEVPGINEDMGYLPSPIPGAAHQILQQVGQNAADFGLGESDVRRGDVGQARNATSAAIAETAGNITDRNIFSQWRDSNEQLGYICLAIARVHCDRTQYIPALGRNDGYFYELKPEFLRDAQWAVRFGGNARGANATQQITTHLNVAQALASTGTLNFVEISREVYRLAGHTNPDRFLNAAETVPAISPEEEFDRLVTTGEDPQFSPSENIADHLQKHTEQLTVLAGQVGTSHPFYWKLYAHWQTTQQAFVQLQGAPAAPGGQQNGGGLSLDRIGGAGEPLSLQGATQGIDVARNGSNVAAGGQAPGPTGSVPGRQVGDVATGGALR